LRNNKFTAGAALVLAIALAGTANVDSVLGAVFRAQDNKESQSADKRADALKKYLEAKRLDERQLSRGCRSL
jgi:hypothetical protein